jgi:hypothetical protein
MSKPAGRPGHPATARAAREAYPIWPCSVCNRAGPRHLIKAREKGMSDTPSQWHLDKKVPIALILGLLVQTMMVGYWLAQNEARLTQLEDANRQAIVTRSANIEKLNKLDGVVQVLVSQSGEIAVRLNRIDDKLDRIIEFRRTQLDEVRP